ncbi:MAG: BirA family biotin operon repressor/biotin-[acetyl-CoA-carboxylase] ligase [Halobacteriales archaeon]|jgi:BirA family biotin operon repressor/biotin-[acetyl-CoA-carboxylase] ligase
MNETRRAVLEALEDGPITGPDLADRLDVSRAAVWKHVEALREGGFDVESTDEGYVLTSIPEFGGMAIEFGLEAPFEIEYHDAIDSTNDRARELAADGAADVVVVAHEQTGGRGRLDRGWASPSGGIWLSIAVKPSLPPAHAPILTLAAAVATAKAAREAGVEAGIKWPNDVLTADDERKLAGILTEMEGEAGRANWVVVGVGINANVEAEALPDGATSLADRRGEPVERRVFVQRLLETFDDLRHDPETVLPEWRALSLTLGRQVRVDTPDGEVVGEAVDVAFPGELVLRTEDGRTTVNVGDCDHLRPV